MIVFKFGQELDKYSWVRWVDEDFGKLVGSFGGEPLAPSWPTPILIRVGNNDGSVRPLGDCPCTAPGVIVLSRRAINALRDLIEPAGEVLPLDSEVGDFVAVNILKKINSLDEERSKLVRFSDGGIMRPERLAFKAGPIGNAVIFKLPVLSAFIFVTQPFADRVREAGLEGFRFKELWRDE